MVSQWVEAIRMQCCLALIEKKMRNFLDGGRPVRILNNNSICCSVDNVKFYLSLLLFWKFSVASFLGILVSFFMIESFEF